MLRPVLKLAVVFLIVAYIAELCFYRYDDEVAISGDVDEAFEAVREAFRLNFAEGWERGGAAFVVYHNGRKVVDLWGGYADKDCKRRWKKDTLNVAFSSTKETDDKADAKSVWQGRPLPKLDNEVVTRSNRGDDDLEDNSRSGRPSSTDDDKILCALERDPQSSLGRIEKTTGAPRETVRRALHQAGKVARRPGTVPHDLPQDQGRMRVDICASNLAH
ncbi:unnamed protein product, partial [Nippostrongylus brasiliensis]|uniref:Beta-lactamase domain-containing protein n=1 Tax=Nippostrongylus brasiliensis TaxID=27835 RepID=A0A0N4YPA6_NIPBR